ncbi:MAG: NAD(P)/FAD-dependent oxidoreductase [bacterium TMED46]|nr:MAG: NAD(P)/FAD-dependent oxidoreductase [bacterium TMED46]|tara:strand:+ start:631 stop:1845 length:1215 start_codon:yes stop_codon:yes gene_type:complete
MYDVIIVGAGPAGSTAALYAHRLGLNCILLDKAVFPRDKICGDALSGKSVRLMRELNLLEGVEELEGSEINRITFGSPSHSQFDVHLKGNKNNDYITKGYVVPRKIFDNFLFKKADELTETRQGFMVNDIIYQNDNISGVKGTNIEGKEEILNAPVIMGCDGANSIIARKLGLYEMDMENTAVAIRCYYEGVEGLSNQIELHYVSEVKPGYFWLFPAGNGKANIGIGLSKNDAKKEDRTLRQIMDEIVQSDYFRSRFGNARPLEKPVGWNLPLGRIQRKNHGNGFMLLGDAAGLVDPFTGEGIGNAMVAAKHAMQVASKAKNHKDYSERSFSEYDQLLWDDIGGELRTSTKLQSLARSSFLLNFVINRAARNEEVQSIISGMLSHEIPKDELSSPMFYLKILLS